MNRTDLCYESTVSLARRIRAGEVSPRDAVSAYLERIERVDPRLHGYLHVAADQAIAAARRAEQALAEHRYVAAYAYARTGYHRGLDQLRRSGWKGHGPIPWSHEPNRGFLRCLNVLARAADAIGEADEAARCAQFLRDSDPAAADALSG